MQESDQDRYFADLKNIGRLTVKEERSLLERVQSGDMKARDTLVWHNLPLVIHIAKGFQNRGIPLIDLIQEGNLGLVESIDAYKHGIYSAKLGTFASYYIRKNILRVLRRKSLIRLPMYLFKRLRQWDESEERLRIALNRVPTFDEVADALGLLSEDPNVPRKRGRPRQRGLMKDALIARQLFEAEGEMPTTPPVTATRENGIEILPLLESVDKLAAHLAEVVYLHFGLSGNEPLTLRQIAKIQGITASAVRMRFSKALLILRTVLEKQRRD